MWKRCHLSVSFSFKCEAWVYNVTHNSYQSFEARRYLRTHITVTYQSFEARRYLRTHRTVTYQSFEARRYLRTHITWRWISLLQSLSESVMIEPWSKVAFAQIRNWRYLVLNIFWHAMSGRRDTNYNYNQNEDRLPL